MSRRNQSNSQETEELILKCIQNVFVILLIIGLLYGAGWMYFVVYNPKQQKFIKRANIVYEAIQEEVQRYYNINQYVWEKNQKGLDPICNALAEKYSKTGGNCVVKQGILAKNFTFDKIKAEVYGLDRPPIEENGTLVKDILIDIDGEQQGENELGKDQVLLRIFSTGLLGAKLVPANCKMSDLLDYGIFRSTLCTPGIEINFMETNIPFGFDIIQFREDKPPKEQYRRVSKNIAFLRADCCGVGGEYFAGDEYCEKRGYSWFYTCSNDYDCKIELTKKR